MLLAVAARMPNTVFCFVWDGEGSTWRHTITEGEYKGNRKPPNEDMRPAFPQIPILRKVLKDAGFREFDFANLECDDLIGILATAAVQKDLFKKVIIYSTDKDFYQLVTNRLGVMRGYDKDKLEQVMFYNDVGNEIEIDPKDWVKVKALTGEVTDNIPKIATGLGPKTAIKMIQAGLDPSKEEFKKHQWVVQQNFGTLASMWGKIRRNYELSKIVCNPNDPHLHREMQDVLAELVHDMAQETFLRDKKKLGDESFEKFTEFLAEYELLELFGQRHEFWRLP